MPQENTSSLRRLLRILEESRNVKLSFEEISLLAPGHSLLTELKVTVDHLQSYGKQRESNALTSVLEICDQPTDLGGLGLSNNTALTTEQVSEILFLVSAWLEALNSADRAKVSPSPLFWRPQGRRGMTLSEKILAMHDTDQKGSVTPGQLIRVDVDWVIASEASWAGMESTYNRLGKPGIFRNDRFWLAGDHVVDPRVNDTPKVQSLIDASERAKRVFKMTDYQGMNYTILHTEFYRERAQPGMLIIGSDSHTCSSGALGCLAIGLGAADVTLPLVTGETWFKVPESVNIRLVGSLKPGIGGKDAILYILQQLKRNTVASERFVEFTGPGVRHLSSDARFAISNMTTEFGGITGIFVPDQITYDFINKRRLTRHKSSSNYFRPDADAQYAETHEINLDNVGSFLARYPKPDDVVPVRDHEGMALHGCFIGACTTAEEDLILGALVLEQGLKQGFKPVAKGKRKVVPGSLPIMHRLRHLGLLSIYEKAGFDIGVPGCSYCVGMSADQAGPGEVWISSQNRNFENRMGKGSIGHLGSAATVAASSFEMKLTDPHKLLSIIDLNQWNNLRGTAVCLDSPTATNRVRYVEPRDSPQVTANENEIEREIHAQGIVEMDQCQSCSVRKTLTGKIQQLGDFIDTDALAPAEFLVGMRNNETSGSHCLEYTHPDFRNRAKNGFDVVVAGKGFGCGSSREQAVMALLGCGVKCVIAKSFAFIFQRNMPNLGLLGITMVDEYFYEAAKDGENVSIDFDARSIYIGGRKFYFQLSQMEKELFEYGGIASAFHKFGNRLFDVMTAPKGLEGSARKTQEKAATPHLDLQW